MNRNQNFVKIYGQNVLGENVSPKANMQLLRVMLLSKAIARTYRDEFSTPVVNFQYINGPIVILRGDIWS